jgi:hypothetical protein
MTFTADTADATRGASTGALLQRPRPDRQFYQCPTCGGWVDSTDPIQVARHEDNPAPLMPAKAS